MSLSPFGLVYEPSLTNHSPHDGGTDHIERPARITSIYQEILNSGMIDLCQHIRGRSITDEEILLAHSPKHLRKMTVALSQPKPYFADHDMYGNHRTLECARLAAGSTIKLITEMISERIYSGLALVRPPGHHATCNKYMGFCFLNNVMIAALVATKLGKRVLVVDWDVHFGNGSSDIMKNNRDNSNLMYFSIHRYDNGTFYPGGKQGASGIYEGGRLINVGFNGSEDDKFYTTTFNRLLLPQAQKFKPDLIIVSAGFDAAEGDPLGQCHVTPKGYYELTKILQKICPRIALVLEGGYNLKSISESCVACIKALLGRQLDEERGPAPEIKIEAENQDYTEANPEGLDN